MVSGTGASGTTKNTRIGTNTGYGEIFSQGTTVNQITGSSVGSQSGHGWLYDLSSLVGQKLDSGNWTATFSSSVSAGTATITLYCRVSIYNGGSYTELGTLTLSGQSFSTSYVDYSFSATSLPAHTIVSGDYLYIDHWVNITTNGTGSSTANYRVTEANSATQGEATDVQVNTAGYSTAATGNTKNGSGRWKMMAEKLKDAAGRFNLTIGNTKNGQGRGKFRAEVLKDAAGRFNLTSGWYDTGYLYRKTITIDHTKVSGSTNLTDFPVLISLIDARLKDKNHSGYVQDTNGYDIIFTDGTSTVKLDHEIDQYDGTSGTILMWVRVPTLSYSVDTVMYMYFDNSSISTSQENVAGVWDSNYLGIWHMDDNAANTTVAGSSDVTNNGTNLANTSTKTTNGQIGRGLTYNGSSDYTDTAAAGTIKAQAQVTISAWVRSAVLDSAKHLIYYECINSADGYTRIGLAIDASNKFTLIGRTADGDSLTVFIQNSTSLSINTWYYVVGVYDSTNSVNRLMINGTDQTSSRTQAAFPNTTPNHVPSIAKESDGLYFWNGILDEVRVSKITRTADWSKTEYNNQNSPSTFYSVTTAFTRNATGRAKFRASQTKDASGRFNLFAGTPQTKNLMARLKLAVSSTKYGQGRAKLRAQQTKDAQARTRIQVSKIVDGAGRFLERASSIRNVSARFKEQVAATINASARFKEWVQTTRDTAGRFKEQVTTTLNLAGLFKEGIASTLTAAARFKEAALSTLDTAGRFKEWVQTTRDTTGRFKERAAKIVDLSGRFKESIAATLDASGRARIRAGQALSGAGRFRLFTPGAMIEHAIGRLALQVKATLDSIGRLSLALEHILDASGRAKIAAATDRLASGRIGIWVLQQITAFARFSLQVAQSLSLQGRVVFLVQSIKEASARFSLFVGSVIDSAGRVAIAVSVLQDVSGRFLIELRNLLSGAGRFKMYAPAPAERLLPGRIRLRAITRTSTVGQFRLAIVPFISWETTDGTIAWETSSGAAEWETASGAAAWETTDGTITWETSSGDLLWRERE